MLGQVEIEGFWTQVEEELARLAPRKKTEWRLRAILRYRNALSSANVNYMVYHLEPTDVARSIMGNEN